MGRSTEDSDHNLDSTAEPLLPLSSSHRSLNRLRHGPPRPSGFVQITALILLGFLVAAALLSVFNSKRNGYIVLDDSQESVIGLAVNGPPTSSFRDNLRNDTQYITSWAAAGWTNDVMTYMNMIYLGLITERVPIVPPFHPTHVGGDAGWVEFGDIFDVPRLSRAIRTPVLEWNQVKDPVSDTVDEIGCWSIWATVQKDEHRPRNNAIAGQLKLDVAYTAVPDSVKMYPGIRTDWHSTFWGLAAVAFPEMHDTVVNSGPHTWPSKNHMSPPDQHLTCYDFPYFVGAWTTYEFGADYSPAWRFVGKHTHWNPNLQELANQYLRRAFGVAEDAPVPPYIGLHLRHNDFKTWCNGVPQDECFAPLSAFVRRVTETKEALLAQSHPFLAAHSITSASDIRVLVTSDDESPEFWEQIRELGWNWVDHGPDGEDTVEKMNVLAGNGTGKTGKWYPALLDAVFQSGGVGFVGTDRSTMSLIAKRRVEDWWGGIGVMVKWGYKDADAH